MKTEVDDTDERNALAEKIRTLLKEEEKRRGYDLVILYVALVGSRAKGVAASRQADYDVKVITMASHQKDYVLQKVQPTIQFSSKFNDAELEGTATDFLQVVKYVMSNNMWAYDSFAGICLFTSDLVEQLRKAWLQQVYDPTNLRPSLAGMLASYKIKKIKTTSTTTTTKMATEALYLAMKLKYIDLSLTSSSATSNDGCSILPPPYDMKQLLKELSSVDAVRRGVSEADGSWIYALIEMRMVDKTAAFELTPKFWNLVDEAISTERRKGTDDEMQQQKPQQRKGQKRRTRKELEKIEEQIHAAFLTSFE
ncbi:hypothetical protein ACA910_013549 [Epithemia clementina (nom. ined.)]